MNYIGMDVHKKQTVFCVVDDAGNVIGRGKVPSGDEGWLAVLRRWASSGGRVAIEAGTTCFWMVSVAREVGVEPVVVDVRRFKIVGQSSKKSDRRDAFELADALRTGAADKCAIVVPSEAARRGRAVLRARLTAKKQSTLSRNAALGLLRSVGVVNLNARRWYSAESWSAALSSPAVPSWMRPLLLAHRGIWQKAHDTCLELDQAIKAELDNWPAAPRLDEIPGFGPFATLALLASVDDAARFRRGKQVGGYSGLAPRVRDSGDTRRRGGVTHEGSAILRHAMVQAALASLRSRHLAPGLRRWTGRLMVQRGRHVAAVALARRLLVLGWKLLKTGERYDPNRSTTLPVNTATA